MNGRLVSASLILLTVLIPAVAPTRLRAQVPPLPAPKQAARGELQREMRKFFADRLRADVDLTDEQAEQVLPQIQRLERERGAVRRQRSETLQQLREGVEGGAGDDELQTLLERLDRTEREQLELKTSAYAEIDRPLTVRQRPLALLRRGVSPDDAREDHGDSRGRTPGRGARLSPVPPDPRSATVIVTEPRSDPRQRLGLVGEAAAEQALSEAGFQILERRSRFRAGEIDLVALDGETLVFVEVKARNGSGYGTPAAAVTPAKQRRIGRVALTLLSRRGWMDRRCRFDVVEVFASGGRVRRVAHIRDAFRL